MPDWKNIVRLTDKEAKTREAQFEAEMLALVAQGGSPPPAPSATTSTAPTSIPTRDGVQITVTDNGQTTRYSNLEAIPASIRQQIINAWIIAPASAVPPIHSAPAPRNTLPSPSAPRPKTMKVAMFLNLLVQGAGQFYFGQRLAGALYALSFLGSFIALFGIFGRGYFKYLSLSTSGDILDSGNIEQVAHAFPVGIISALSIIGIVIYLASTIHLAMSRPRSARQPVAA